MSINLDWSQTEAALHAGEAELAVSQQAAESAEALRQRLERSSHHRLARWAQAESQWKALRHALAEKVAIRQHRLLRQRAGLVALMARLPGALASWAYAASRDRLLALARRAGLFVRRGAAYFRLALCALADALRRLIGR